MTLTQEEADNIKEHLLKQLKNFPEEKREEIEKRVREIPSSQVEEFVKENQLTHLANQCIFCSIIAAKMPSFKIQENNKNLAILEINPLSKGHTLVIPKSHEEKVGEESREFAKQVAQVLVQKLRPKEVKIGEINIMGHAALEVVPLFGQENERWQASGEELKKLQEEILHKEERPQIIKEVIQEKPKNQAPLYKLPPRIP